MNIGIIRLPFAEHFSAFGIIRLTLCSLFGRLIFFLLEQGCRLNVNLQQPLPAFVNALRLLSFVEFVVCPYDRDDTQPHISRIRRADCIETCEFHQPGKHFA